MDHVTLKSYPIHSLEIRRLKKVLIELKAESRGLSLTSPPFSREGHNPNSSRRGISDAILRVEQQIFKVEDLITARQILIDEVVHFINCIVDEDIQCAFKMKFIEGFTYQAVHYKTGIQKRTFLRHLDREIEAFNCEQSIRK